MHPPGPSVFVTRRLDSGDARPHDVSLSSRHHSGRSTHRVSLLLDRVQAFPASSARADRYRQSPVKVGRSTRWCTRSGAGNSAVSNLLNGPGVGSAEAVKPLGRFSPEWGHGDGGSPGSLQSLALALRTHRHEAESCRSKSPQRLHVLRRQPYREM